MIRRAQLKAKNIVKFEPRPAKQVTITPRPQRIATGSGLVSLALALPAAAEQAIPPPNRAEREHMGRVAALGCLLCRMPAEVHHIREGQGMAQRASNWLTVPLCPEHHRGTTGLHGLGERGFERRYRLGELDLLAQTIAALSSGAAPEFA